MLECCNVSAERSGFTLHFDLHVQEGELLALLGPSGAGKSTILECIAGFIAPKTGSISFNNRNISELPPHERNLCMVFQDYALFPHMNVEENIAYGLRMRGYSKTQRKKRVLELLDLFNIRQYAGSKIYELSGGEQQRIALARALAPSPDILLLDEPLAALDKSLRHQIRNEIRSIQQQTNISCLYVTHDQEEAFAISDRIALIQDGRVEQVGTAEELYRNPQSTFAASFLGECILLRAKKSAEDAGQVETELGMLHVSKPITGNRVQLCIRPEDIQLHPLPERPQPGKNIFGGEIIEQEFRGSQTMLRVRSAEAEVLIQVPGRTKVEGRISFSIPPELITLIEAR